jgi:hypothetical protein
MHSLESSPVVSVRWGSVNKVNIVVGLRRDTRGPCFSLLSADQLVFDPGRFPCTLINGSH